MDWKNSICIDPLSALEILVIFVYGIVKFWPDYKRQKRIENNSIAALNALSQLEDSEESLRQLFKITKLASSHESHLPAQNEALTNLRALKNHFMLLRTNSLIQEKLS